MVSVVTSRIERVAVGCFTDPDERAIMVAPLATVLAAIVATYQATSEPQRSHDDRPTVRPEVST